MNRLTRLLEDLKALIRSRQSEFRNTWNRSLPMADYLVDRWEKARGLGFGEGSSIYDSSLVLGNVSVGCHTWIGPFTVLDGTGGLQIGDYCSVSAGVQIYTHDTLEWALSGGVRQSQQAPVKIGNRTYLGPGVIIAKGVSIGSCCVIGANSFVNKDIPDCSKAWGSPARVVGLVDAQFITSLNEDRFNHH